MRIAGVTRRTGRHRDTPSGWNSDQLSIAGPTLGVTDNPPILFGYQIGIVRQNGGDAPFNLHNVRRHFLEGDGGGGYKGCVNCLNCGCVPHDYLTHMHVCTTSESEFSKTGLPSPCNQGTTSASAVAARGNGLSGSHSLADVAAAYTAKAPVIAESGR